MTKFFMRFRRPLTVMVSVAAAVVMTLPLEAQQPKLSATSLRPARLPVPQKIGAFKPAKLVLPSLRVEAPIVEVLTAEDGTMGSPTNATDIGWYPGQKPGTGNALFDSHHDWNGAEGSFYRLEEVKPGDTVVVIGDHGEKFTYAVMWTKQVNGGIDATDLLGNHPGKQEVTLITCGGAFDTFTRHHVDRIVVRAELVWA